MGIEAQEQEEVRRARMLTRTLQCVAGICDTSMHFDMLISTKGGHLSLTEIRKMTPFGRGNQLQKFLRRKAGFYLTIRNLLMVKVEHITEYLGCLLNYRELEFPSDLTEVTDFTGGGVG